MEQRLTRREFLILSGGGLAAARVLGPEALFAQTTTIRQGFQTNIWGMPTYYLLRSGALEKRGLKFEEFAVPSGNLTMQQMVARQVDLGTYAGQSFVIGHDKGGLVAIAQIASASGALARSRECIEPLGGTGTWTGTRRRPRFVSYRQERERALGTRGCGATGTRWRCH